MIRIIRIATATALAAAGLGMTSAAEAKCFPVESPPAGVAVCYSLVNNCVDANVYYRVLGSSGNTATLAEPICP